MDCCQQDASSKRRALLSEFQQFLDHVEQSERYADEGRGVQRNVYDTQRPQIPAEHMQKLAKYPAYMDPTQRPLITNVQVLEYRPTGKKALLDQKIPDITGVEYCEIPATKPNKLPNPPPGLVEKIMANKELGYPAPGEKSPYLYRTPQPVPLEPPPRYPPPPPMDHRAGLPCHTCEPPVQSGSTKRCPSVARIDTTTDECQIDDPHCHMTYGKVAQRTKQLMSSSTSVPKMARMRPDPATTRCVQVSTAHQCPAGYGEGSTAVRTQASAQAPGGPSRACPESCVDILKDQERRGRDRKQLEYLPGDLKVGEPKICPPGFPVGQRSSQRGGPQRRPMQQRGQHQSGAMVVRGQKCSPRTQQVSSSFEDPRMCPQNFSVGRSPDMPTGQDPKCSVDYEKCSPKRRPGVCGPTNVGTSLDYNPLCSREKTKSRELIGGVLLTGCDCVKRNGLQHDCRRTLCQGRPECLTNPPMCLPSGGPGCIPASYFDC